MSKNLKSPKPTEIGNTNKILETKLIILSIKKEKRAILEFQLNNAIITRVEKFKF